MTEHEEAARILWRWLCIPDLVDHLVSSKALGKAEIDAAIEDLESDIAGRSLMDNDRMLRIALAACDGTRSRDIIAWTVAWHEPGISLREIKDGLRAIRRDLRRAAGEG